MPTSRPFRALPALCLLLCLLLTAPFARAATYTFANAGKTPACSNGNWSQSGSTWTCNGSFSLAAGDQIAPGATITIVANAGITLNGNNAVGSASAAANLTATYGPISIGSGSTVYGAVGTQSGNLTATGATITGNLSTASGDLTLTNTTVNGNISTGSGGNITLNDSTVNGTITGGGTLTLSGGTVSGNVSAQNGVSSSNGTVFGGGVSASNGAIALSGGSVAGGLSSGCCTITATNVNIGGGISTTVINSARNTITLTGCTIAGQISSSGGNGVVIANSTMTGGSITTTSVPITISGSTLGSPSSNVTVSSNNSVTVSNSTVYGNVTAASWPGSLSVDNASTVVGVCTSNTDSITSPDDHPRCTGATGTNVARFNACHNYSASAGCASASGRLYTQLAGTAFSTDIVALKSDGSIDTSFTGKATISIVAKTSTGGALDGQNCFTAADATQTVNAATTSFVAGRLSVNTTIASAYPDVRFRIVCDAANCASSASGVTACSADDFAVRPGGFSSITASANADASGASPSATPIVKAGAAFTLTASAGAGYNGTPKVSASQVAAHGGAVRAGTVAASFAAATAATGTASATTATYDEVGYFRFGIAGVYDDSFTYVDLGHGDCTGDYSNTPVNGKIGCYFGNTAASGYFGRFVPHHLTTGIGQAGCPAGAFTYSGQPLTLTVAARNAAGNTTQNYDAGTPQFAKALTLSAFAADGTTAAPGGGTLATTSAAATLFAKGIASIGDTYTFGAKLTAPATVLLRAVDADGISSAAAGGGSESGGTIRSGQLRIANAFGSAKSALTLPVQAQYWSGSSWVLNGADACTTIPLSAFFLSGPLAAATGVGAAVTLTNGQGGIVLAAPSSGQTGSVDVALNLGSAGSDLSCLASHGGTGAGLAWLRSRNGNCAATYDRDPAARASFGVYAPETRKTVHSREIF